MSRNGSGTYVLPSGNPVVTGTTITSNWANTTLSDIATALTGSVAADGQTPMTGALSMTNNKITNLADGVDLTDAATVNQIANPNIIGGSIDNTPIGNLTPSTGKFTTLDVSAGATLTGVCTAPTITPGTDSSTKIATTAFVQSAISAISSGVTSFNSRTGNVTLTSGDVTGALGYTPYNSSGATVINTSNISSYAPTPTGGYATGNWNINITGNAATSTSAGTANGLSGSPNISVGTVTATGNIKTTGGNVEVAVGGGSSSLQTSNSTTASVQLGAVGYGVARFSGAINLLTATATYSFYDNTNCYNAQNATSWNTTSDINVKTNVRPVTGSLNKIVALTPKHYEYKDELGKTRTGFIAQEFEQVLPGHVSDVPVPEKYKKYMGNSTTMKSLSVELIPYLVGAIKELKAEIDAQAAEIAALKG